MAGTGVRSQHRDRHADTLYPPHVTTSPSLILLLFAPFAGSFLGTVARRLPAGRAVVFDRSCCEACGHGLAVRDLVPLVSWLLARGRCRHCGVRVSVFYPAIELTALGIAGWAVAVLPGGLAWVGAVLGWTLLTLAIIDARHTVLPDVLTLPLIPAGLLVAWVVEPAQVPHHAIGAVAGFAAFVAIAWAYRRIRRREGLGLGDAKLLKNGTLPSKIGRYPFSIPARTGPRPLPTTASTGLPAPCSLT